jgi:hypothetical protein
MRSIVAILMVRSVAKRRVSNHRIACTPYVSAYGVEPGNDEVSSGLTRACGFDLSAIVVEQAASDCEQDWD